MPKEEKAANSRQSVDLKWRERKGLEENVAFDGGKTEVGGDAEVDGSLTLNSPSDLKTKDGSEGFVDLNTEQEISAPKKIGGIWFGTGLKYPCIGFNKNILSSGNFVFLGYDDAHWLRLNSHGNSVAEFYGSGMVAYTRQVPSVRHHLVFSSDSIYACADLLTTPDNSAALTMDGLAGILDAPLTVSGLYKDGDAAFPVVSVFNESGVLYFAYLVHDGGKVQNTSVGAPGLSGLTLTDTVDATMQAKEAPSWQDGEEEQ